jgi:hypothetical protein
VIRHSLRALGSKQGFSMVKRKQTSWKTKMGVEFSGLEGTRDFLVAFGFVLILIIVGMLIAYITFG